MSLNNLIQSLSSNAVFISTQAEESHTGYLFSFLAFAFLLDPPTKVRVLHLDACAHMRIRYQEAIVHQVRTATL